MSKAYSLDLRQRVVQFVEAGHSRCAAAGAKRPLVRQFFSRYTTKEIDTEK